jgi:hypothetical protein
MRQTAILALLMVSGCAATPSVRFHALGPASTDAAPDRDNWIPFRLTDSTIVLGAAQAPPAMSDPVAIASPIGLERLVVTCQIDTGCDGNVAAMVAPIDDADAVYAIEPRSKNFVSTRIAPTYVRDSLRLVELAVEVKDHRLEVIKTIGALVSGGAALIGGGGAENQGKAAGAELALPVVIDLDAARAPADPGAVCRPGGPALPCHELPRNAGWSYRLVFLDDAAADGFRPRSDITRVEGAMVASVCRRARLAIDYTPAGGSPVPMVTLALRVADPEYLMTMPMPAKGQLRFHRLCGIDMARESVTEVGIDEMAAAAIASGVAAVRAAQ